MEMKPVHCCLLLVVMCILFLSVTLLEGDEQTNYEPQKYCDYPEEGNIVDGVVTDPQGNIRIAKEITLLDATKYVNDLPTKGLTDPVKKERNKVRKDNIKMLNLSTDNLTKSYYTRDSNPVAVGESLTCEQITNDIYPCNTFLGLNENGSYSRCTDSPDLKNVFGIGKCQKGTGSCSMRKYLRQEGVDGYNLEQLTVPPMESNYHPKCDSIYKNQEEKAWDYGGGKFSSGSAVGRTSRSRFVSLQPVPSDQPINAHLDNNKDGNPCGKFQGELLYNNHRYTICGDGWIWKDNKYVCPKGNCVDTTEGGQANVCEPNNRYIQDDIDDNQSLACGNAVAYLCKDVCYDEQSKSECIRCIQDNSNTLIKNNLCSFPDQNVTTYKDIETKPDTIYTQYQGYKNNEGRRDLYK